MKVNYDSIPFLTFRRGDFILCLLRESEIYHLRSLERCDKLVSYKVQMCKHRVPLLLDGDRTVLALVFSLKFCMVKGLCV